LTIAVAARSHAPEDPCTFVNDQTGCPAWAVIPLFVRSLRRQRSRIPAAKAWSVADNLL